MTHVGKQRAIVVMRMIRTLLYVYNNNNNNGKEEDA
jgi:hypothetical protein